MKPKHLKCPFDWENRHPLIFDRVVYVPEYYDCHKEFSFPHWSDPLLFGREGKVFVEYCSGNGAWILEKALQQPDCLWVAVEKKFERVRKIWSKIQNFKLNNLIVISGEAYTFTTHYLPDNGIESCYINFPDPWPKERHAKHRLFHDSFLGELSKKMKREGKATVVTDDAVYSRYVIDQMAASPNWTSAYPEPHFVTAWENYGTSYFDRLWREKGKTIHYMQFINQKKEL